MAKIPISAGFRVGGLITGIVKYGLMGLFVAYLFVTIIMTGIAERDVGVVIEQLGEEIFNPLSTAQEYALEMQTAEPQPLLDNLWDYWGFFFQLYKLWLWFKLFLFGVNIFLKDSNAPFIRWLFAIILFLGVLVVHSVWMLGESPNYPFVAFKEIFQGLFQIMPKEL